MSKRILRRPGRVSAHRGLFFLLAMVALAGVVAACSSPASPFMGGGSRVGTPSDHLPFQDTGSRIGTEPGAQLITFMVVGASDGASGPDGRRHDTFRATSSTTVVAGRPVTIEIANSDEMPHSFTIRQLGIDRLVPAAANGNPGMVTFTFTPTTSGTYRWFCALPCDQDNGGWAMGPYASMNGGMMRGGTMGGGMVEPGVDGFMAGYISVTAG